MLVVHQGRWRFLSERDLGSRQQEIAVRWSRYSSLFPLQRQILRPLRDSQGRVLTTSAESKIRNMERRGFHVS
jgi:hypothetical protein